MRRFLDVSLAAVIAAMGLSASDQAFAQAGENFARDRNVSVRGRPKPEYDAVGIRFGTFRAYPELQLAAEYNDNIFATNANEEADVIGHVAPELQLRSTWSNHELNASVSARSRIYSEFSEHDTTDLIGTVDGRLDVYRDFNLFGAATVGEFSEPLASSPSALPLDAPVQYTMSSVNGGFVKAFNRLRVSAQAQSSAYDFDDATSIFGAPVEQDDRDRTVFTYGGRADFALSPMTSLFVAATANERDYDVDPPVSLVDRDSEGYEVLVGANFDVTRLIRGEIGIGYLSQTYDDVALEDSNGLAVRTRVEWFPDELVTVTFGAVREVADAGAFGATSYIANNASLAIDYELRRNVIVGVGFDYSVDDYTGIDREDTRWNAIAKVDYAMNRGVSLFFEGGRYEQSSQGLSLGREYEINRAVIGIRLRR